MPRQTSTMPRQQHCRTSQICEHILPKVSTTLAQETSTFQSTVQAEKPPGFVIAIQSITAKHTTVEAQEAIGQFGIGLIVNDIRRQVGGDTTVPITLLSQGDRRRDKTEAESLPGRGVAETLVMVALALKAGGHASVSVSGITDKNIEALNRIFPELTVYQTVDFSKSLSTAAVQSFYPGLPDGKCKYATTQIAASLMADALYIVHTPSWRKQIMSKDTLSAHAVGSHIKHVLFVDHQGSLTDEQCAAAVMFDSPDMA